MLRVNTSRDHRNGSSVDVVDVFDGDVPVFSAHGPVSSWIIQLVEQVFELGRKSNELGLPVKEIVTSPEPILDVPPLVDGTANYVVPEPEVVDVVV